jgi:mycofactocin glycosyltransferase
VKYTIDRSLQMLGDERQIMGGSPLRLFTLTEGGVNMLARLQVGEDLARNVLIDRLADAGVIHPQPSEPGRFTDDDVTFVVPAFGPVRITDLGPRMVVVDDASPEGRPIVPHHAIHLRRQTNGGPGAARTTGLTEVTTPLVAFVDADVVVSPGWLDGLLPHFIDDRVALVAPRVMATAGDGVLARFEAVRSPIDLGPEPARVGAKKQTSHLPPPSPITRVRARTRVSYLPTAAIVVRADVLRAIGGFDVGLRTGEDVDLMWRLVDAGYIVRYEPSVVVHHATRPTLRSWLKQRQGYGQSAGPLATRHPGALAPLGVSGWSAGVWGLVGLGHPIAAVGVAVGTAVALVKKLPTMPTKAALNLVRYGHLGAAKQIASAITRAWWPLALLVSVFSKRARRVVLASAVVPALMDWRKDRPKLDPAQYVALRVLDDGAYGFGLWQGAWRARTTEPLTPDLTSWPRPSRFERRSSDQ